MVSIVGLRHPVVLMRVYFVGVVLLFVGVGFKGFAVCPGPSIGWEALLFDTPLLVANTVSLAAFVVNIQCFRLLTGAEFLLREVIGIYWNVTAASCAIRRKVRDYRLDVVYPRE